MWDFPHIAVGLLEFALAAGVVEFARWTRSEPALPAHVRGQYCHCDACRRQGAWDIERGKPENYINGRYLHASQQRHVLSDMDLLARGPHTKNNRCTNCGDKCRKSIYHPSPSHPGLTCGQFSVALCEPCFRVRQAQGEDLVSYWMGFDLVR